MKKYTDPKTQFLAEIAQISRAEETRRRRAAAKLTAARTRFFDLAAFLLIENDNKMSLTRFKTEMRARNLRLPASLETFLKAEGFTLTQSPISANLIFVSI